MKILIPILAGCLVTSSCTTYQLMTVSSPVAQQNIRNELIIENDSLEVSYNFNGQNGPVKMLVRNKLDKSVYIDWNRSALVVNDQAISYASKRIEINGVTTGSSFNWTKDFATTRSAIHATAKIPSDMEFLPPRAYVVKELPGVTNQSLDYLPDSVFSKGQLPAMDGYEKVKVARFTADNSPLIFKSYLTLMVGDSAAKPVVCQHIFYISELVKTDTPPAVFSGDARGDRFFVVKGELHDPVTGYGIVNGSATIPYTPLYRRTVLGSASK